MGGAIPAIPFCFVGGSVVDIIGVRKAMLIYGSIVGGGALMILFGGVGNNFPIMLTGTILNSLAAELLIGAINALFSKWF